MSFVTPADFIGEFEISQNPRETQKLQGYIDVYEDKYMMELLGVTLYDEYKAGLAELPPDPIFIKLLDSFAQDVTDGCLCGENKIIVSKGVKTMLLGFIFYEFYKDDFSKSTINGRSKTAPENAVNSSTFLAGIYSRYNESLTTYRAIQEYIKINLGLYPNYNGQKKLMANWF